MSIIFYLGNDVKEYTKNKDELINEYIEASRIICKKCLKPMSKHSEYTRGIKETGQQINITMVWCKKCRIWDAILPDFLLERKHYSANEIESVIIESATAKHMTEIDTKASESTVRRWVTRIGESIKRAIGILKYLFRRAGQAVSETSIEPGPVYGELEQLLEMAPSAVKYSGNKLGLTNLWMGTNAVRGYI